MRCKYCGGVVFVDATWDETWGWFLIMYVCIECWKGPLMEKDIIRETK